ncbi:sugar phosphate isomerase/epimerase family protein [Paenibacillus cremeus]|uniref:Sugar phosphate isomerase/epimerase n=1 Tax=Paenibacillus cremeus TaxID=2163881 RepID=A0A559K7B3_9BACL|nr:sugar phosphate isomerase/epimerase [Paenibacillus cremeus]TVY08022.1 sugar phosphate isomerase/epimerase [Paenibacillus cremeus]
MKLGACVDIEQADIAFEAGYDYLECTVRSLKPEESDYAFRDTMTRFLESPLPVEAFNILLPGELKIVGEAVDYDRVKRYLEKALERVKRIGGETIVFGSGGARRLPDGFSREKGNEQIVQFLHMIADYADPLDITIVIEPLYKKASNTMNVIPEAVEMARKVNRKSICVLADFFHMVEESDPLENIVKYKDYIRHIHTSDNYTPPGKGEYPYPSFVDCIKRANYDGRISIECVWNDFAKEAADSRRFVQQAFNL